MASTTSPNPKKDSSKGAEQAPETRTPLILVTKPGKKVEVSYYLFEGSEDTKDNRLARIVATKAANRVLKYPNAEEILKDELQPGFVKLAWESGWTLVDVVKKAAEENAALNQVASYVYDTSGRLTQVIQTDPQTGQRQIRTWSYDGLGRLVGLSQPESGPTGYDRFDVNGRPWRTDYNGRKVNSEFDALGRVKAVRSEDGSVNQSFTYGDEPAGTGHGSSKNKLVLASANGAQRALNYFELNGRLNSLVRSVDGLDFSQSFAYDSYGVLKTRTYPDGRSVSLGMDDVRGVPSNAYGALQGTSTLLADLRYDATTWNLTNLYLGNGAASSFGYDKDQVRLTAMGHTTPHASMSGWNWTYSYDAAGRLLTDSEDTYTYDNLNRLTAATVKAPSGDPGQTMVQSFQYDAFGNRFDTQSAYKTGAMLPAFSQAVTASFARGAGSFAKNQLPATTTSGAPTGAMYDPQGNLIQVFARVGDTNSQIGLTYDSLGRVTTVSSSTGTEDYLHDDEGLRIRVYERSTGRTKYNIYNEGRQLVAQYEKPSGGSLTWKRDIAYVGAKEVAEFTPAGLQVTMCDHLGTPRFVWDGVNAVQRQKFLPFGERHPASAPGTSGKGFTNHEQTDPSGLIYMQARMYLPWAGRFASPDPARDQYFGATQSWNIYSYVRNSPIQSVDPTGMIEYSVFAPGLKKENSSLKHNVFAAGDGSGNQFNANDKNNPLMPNLPQKNQIFRLHGQDYQYDGKSWIPMAVVSVTALKAEFERIDCSAVYWMNRRFGKNGHATKSSLSHSFLFTTRPDGTLLHTYSCGLYRIGAWTMDAPEDMTSVMEAIYGHAEKNWIGGPEFVKNIEIAYNLKAGISSEYSFPLNNCKDNLNDLVKIAIKLQSVK